MQNQLFLFTLILSLLVITPTDVFAEHVFKDIEAFGQYLDITQIMAEKIIFEIGDDTYDIYYGYKGSLDSMGVEHTEPTLSSMNINEERKSIEIIMEDIPEKTDFWVRIPQDVLYAEGGKFLVLVDGVDTRYDLMEIYDDQVIGFVITENTKNIEIVGTKVIPEFGVFAVLILGISISGLVYFTRKLSFGNVWTRAT